jgi:chorismate synthase
MARVVEIEGGKVCVQPRIEVTPAYWPLVVEVGSELAPDGCLHEVVLQHEQEHVKAHGDHLGTAVRSLSRSLPQQLGPSVFLADNLAQAAAAIDAALDAAVEKAIQQELDKVRGSHEAIDTAEESERMHRVCGGALQGLWKKAERVASPAR